jgi:hypothetical protein
VLALLVALVTVVTAMIHAVFWALDRDSATSVILTKFDTDTVSLLAWNSGRRPSSVVKCTLEFGAFPYEDTELALSDNTERTMIPPTSASINGVPLKFRLPRLTRRCRARKTTAEAALRVDIEESNNRKMLRLPLSVADIGVIRDKKNFHQVDPCE